MLQLYLFDSIKVRDGGLKYSNNYTLFP
uniref:Uncharacterized protein n=1 Tax=Arundo donax TaxID=35708 RepID=A0A0A9BYU2_ARUDO